MFESERVHVFFLYNDGYLIWSPFFPLHTKLPFSTLSRKNIIENLAVNVLLCHVMPIQWFYFPSQHDSHTTFNAVVNRYLFTYVGLSMCVCVNTAWTNLISIWIGLFIWLSAHTHLMTFEKRRKGNKRRT